VSDLLTGDVPNRRAQDIVFSVVVSHDGQWIVSGSRDDGVRFWDVKSGIVQLMLQGHKNSGLSSPSRSKHLGLIFVPLQSSQLI